MAAFATTAATNAAVAGACRPTTPARTSSARPVSSSARVCRTTRKMLMIATATMTVRAISLAIIAPSV